MEVSANVRGGGYPSETVDCIQTLLLLVTVVLPVLTAWEMEANAAWSLEMERLTDSKLGKCKVNESLILFSRSDISCLPCYM